jgi:hypothetical protein
MIQTPGPPDVMPLPPVAPRRGHRRIQLAAFVALLAATIAVVVFFSLVMIPSAGAAGGCGGG